MNERELRLIKAIDELNLENIELKNSKEYKLGSKLIRNFKLLKQRKILSLISNYKINKNVKYINYNLCSHKISDNNKYYNEINVENEWKPKVAVYTCVVGNYDNVKDPLFCDYNFNYFLFTDNMLNKYNVWSVLRIPSEVSSLKDNTLINRYIKLHPKKFFSEYDFAVYIDGNIRVISDLRPMIYKSEIKLGLAMHKHISRDCLYLEAEACIRLGKGNKEKLQNQINKYKEEGVLRNLGLLEANMIISDMKNDKAEFILDEWWKEFIESKSLRDQIALPYVLWKNGYKINDIGILGDNIYKNPKIQIKCH